MRQRAQWLEQRGAMNRLFEPLAEGFRLGLALRAAAYRRGWFRTWRLNRPVVCVGNLTVGGTGKTPLVAYIAEKLVKRGWKPGILTRGYGRRGGPPIISLEPDPRRAPPAREVGDEAALLARSLPEVPIVVGSDRYRAGRLAEDRFNVGVHILDDGFQLLRLARDLDIVLLDVTQEFSDRAILPAGPLREPCGALKRAHLVVLTRVELADPLPLEERVRKINPQALIFHSRTRFCGMVDLATGTIHSPETLRGAQVCAFCGIGNPRAFFADLRSWNLSVIIENAFGDHHVYREAELVHIHRVAQNAGAVALVATQKDAMNLAPLEKPALPMLICVIQPELDEEQAFEEVLIDRLKAVRAETS